MKQAFSRKYYKLDDKEARKKFWGCNFVVEHPDNLRQVIKVIEQGIQATRDNPNIGNLELIKMLYYCDDFISEMWNLIDSMEGGEK